MKTAEVANVLEPHPVLKKAFQLLNKGLVCVLGGWVGVMRLARAQQRQNSSGDSQDWRSFEMERSLSLRVLLAAPLVRSKSADRNGS